MSFISTKLSLSFEINKHHEGKIHIEQFLARTASRETKTHHHHDGGPGRGKLTLRFFCYLYDSNFNNLGGEYDYITWGSEEEESIDLLVGEYTETSTCYDMTYDLTSWTALPTSRAMKGGVPITTAYPLSYCFLLYLPLGDERISGIKDAYSCIQGNWRRIGPPPHNKA